MRAAAFALAALLPCIACAVDRGDPAPAIAIPRLEDGKGAITIAELKGKVVYVDFWASWCVPCRVSMPALDAMQQKHGARGFKVVGVNKDATLADAQRFIKRLPVSFTLGRDETDAVAKAFDVKAMPSGYLIDRRGMVRKVHRGFTVETAAALEQDVEDLLKEQ